ncbi:MAG: GntR family transcriptional regulator [Mycobacterium leprae]
MPVDRSSPIPLHHQLRAILQRQILSGTWVPNDMIPPEAELVEQYGVSRITVRQALAALVAEGLLYRRQGKGTFVAPARISESLDTLMGFAESLRLQGHAPEISVLSLEKAAATADIADALHLPEGEPVLIIERLIKVMGEPLLWDRSYLAAALEPAPDRAALERQTMLEWLESTGLRISEATQTMSARLVSEEEAAVLEIAPGNPVMIIHRTVSSGSGPVLFSRVAYRSDRHEYRVTLKRK